MAVYLDHNATSPLLPEAAAAMRPFLDAPWGNPSSAHSFGRRARSALDRARGEVRALAGGPSGDLVFTGSGTEAVFLGMAGGARKRSPRPAHVAVSAVEHAAGIAAARTLERDGWRVSWIPPDSLGRVTVDAVAGSLNQDTVLVSVLHANNETGTIMPVEGIAALCRERRILFHTDAVQSAGKIPILAESWGADLVSLSAHKLGGPPGIGALWIRRGLPVEAVIPGSQEGGIRGGTANLPAAVGFGRAAVLAASGMEARNEGPARLRRRLEDAVARIPGSAVTGAGSERLPNTVHLTFDPAAGPDLVPALDLEGFAVSAGSACASGSPEPSHVLLALGMTPERARTAVRVSLGPGNTEEDVDRFADALARVLALTRTEARP